MCRSCLDDNYCLAGNFCCVQIFTISRTGLLPQKCEKKKWTTGKMEMMMSLCVYINTNQYSCVRDGFLQSVCPLSGHCREESACYYTKCQLNKPIKKKVVEVEISSAESFYSTSQFLVWGHYFIGKYLHCNILQCVTPRMWMLVQLWDSSCMLFVALPLYFPHGCFLWWSSLRSVLQCKALSHWNGSIYPACKQD